jgi:hypothetical protein
MSFLKSIPRDVLVESVAAFHLIYPICLKNLVRRSLLDLTRAFKMVE